MGERERANAPQPILCKQPSYIETRKLKRPPENSVTMVVSLNPWDDDHRRSRGRYTNAEIGERMVAAHCYSLLKLKRLRRA